MLEEILREIANKPNLSKSEQENVLNRVKDSGIISVEELGEMFAFTHVTWWRRRKNNEVPRIIKVFLELQDKAQKYDEIKKI